MYVPKSLRILILIVIITIVTTGVVWATESPVLKREMTGAAVVRLQQILDSLGYDLTIDGKFGQRTELAVRTFQQDSGLLADGIVGPATWQALESLGGHLVHQVARGDSLSVLAVKYGASVADIMDANDLTDHRIYIGQKLIIPTKSFQANRTDNTNAEPSIGSPVMMTYQVQPGESTYVIAKRFNTTITAITEANKLKNPSLLRVGQRLLVPTPREVAEPGSLVWPVIGPISSGYGWRTHPIYKNRQFHGGIDIAVPTGTSILAAGSGKVIRAGDMDGFGLGVVIDHGGGVTTWYGHNSKLLVKEGDLVQKGQLIAKSGSTGISTGPHLDFRIKVNGITVDPLSWLPSKKKLY